MNSSLKNLLNKNATYNVNVVHFEYASHNEAVSEIAKARAEYAALVAVAEAAEALQKDSECYCLHEGIAFRGPCGFCIVKSALTNLAAVRGQ